MTQGSSILKDLGKRQGHVKNLGMAWEGREGMTVYCKRNASRATKYDTHFRFKKPPSCWRTVLGEGAHCNARLTFCSLELDCKSPSPGFSQHDLIFNVLVSLN